MILDTCALLWLASDQRKLSAEAKRVIRKHADSLFVSTITAFEVAIKSRGQKLELPLPVAEWYAEVLEFHGIRELPMTSAITIASVQLPALHNDPCDRIIITTGVLHDMKIITCDTLVSQYDAAKTVW
ncbi:MAG: twitching motility protein PilT [Nitrospirales bacterium]|nr:MAG: twitching motility protein PilT [Nitrospirales bacterium]